ncbi:ECF RNA polymerase sigma factor SigK [Nocardioides marmoribigeumensis]|uniref:RNA polymerase sigma factor n=1 Tax=Nocardioides marmoribigeumensis TaxID=433649 RepID=A0ABU2C0G6_9ACTN|nr:ECF RNA polymerase sigma factor SigK [Nocardioides marmoribigeumensis]MDR7364158.1 RNA polymerase sigma-70 factor (ECF subfamily) [Nocardioides marmoribigeumensis]
MSDSARNERTDLRVVRTGAGDDVSELLGRVARGDSEAFAGLYDALNGSVYGLARRVVRDPERAEDVAQEVFLEVWRKAPTYESSKGTAKTWILTIAHRRAVDAVRRNEASRKYEARTVVDDVQHDAPGDELIGREEQKQVRDCLQTLTDLQLESVQLAYYQGYTYSEVATLLDKPLPTIKTRMRDGLIRLRDCMEVSA